MKRFFCAVMAFLLILLCCGCRTDKSESNDDQSSSAQSGDPLSSGDNQSNTQDVISTLSFGKIMSPPTQSEKPQLDKSNFPTLDGSTANIPMAIELYKHFLGVSDEEAEKLVNFHTTSYSYRRLRNKDCSLLLVYEASEETAAMLSEEYANFELYPIGRDALVFLANKNNPVTGLTSDQIVRIYSGNIKNWKEVGGEDKEIVAFQRPEASGSQALMKKLLMKDTPMMDAPTKLVEDSMAGLIDAVAEYDNSGKALGYSVYFYASLMYENPGLKFLDVDGVTPNRASIKSKEYLLTNDFYAVIRADEPADSPARQLAYWLCGEEGKKLFERLGYVAN